MVSGGGEPTHTLTHAHLHTHTLTCYYYEAFHRALSMLRATD